MINSIAVQYQVCTDKGEQYFENTHIYKYVPLYVSYTKLVMILSCIYSKYMKRKTVNNTYIKCYVQTSMYMYTQTVYTTF